MSHAILVAVVSLFPAIFLFKEYRRRKEAERRYFQRVAERLGEACKHNSRPLGEFVP